MQITDHFPQFMVLRNTHVSHCKSESLKYDYSKFVEDAFLEYFNQIDFNYLENSDLDINSKFDRFLKDLSTLTNKHAPIKRLSRKERKLKDKPWMNKRILKMMRIRDRILQKLRKQQNPDNLNLYKLKRDKLKKQAIRSKSDVLMQSYRDIRNLPRPPEKQFFTTDGATVPKEIKINK